MSKQELISALREAGVTKVEARYAGSGDEGYVQEISYEPPVEAASLNEDVEAFIDEETERRGLDWCNDEGGGGVLTIDVQAGTAHFDHYNNVESTESVPFSV